MYKFLYPNIMVDSIYDLDINELYNKNIKGLILDIDNTLVGHGIIEADDKVVQWIEDAKSIGIKACIVSNNTESRVIKFTEKLKIQAIHRASKPRKRAFLKAAQIMELPLEQIAVVGDQLFTDILGGNRLGMLTILVKPIHPKEPITIRLKRVVERIVLKRFVNK